MGQLLCRDPPFVHTTWQCTNINRQQRNHKIWLCSDGSHFWGLPLTSEPASSYSPNFTFLYFDWVYRNFLYDTDSPISLWHCFITYARRSMPDLVFQDEIVKSGSFEFGVRFLHIFIIFRWPLQLSRRTVRVIARGSKGKLEWKISK